MFYHHVSQMDYETLEMPSVQDMQNRAQDTMRSSLAIVDQIFNLCSAIISIVLMGTIISTLHPVIIFVVAVVVFVNSRATKWLNGKQFEINKELSFFARFMLTVTTMISGFYFVKENRLFGMFPLLIEKYKKKAVKNSRFRRNCRLHRFRQI